MTIQEILEAHERWEYIDVEGEFLNWTLKCEGCEWTAKNVGDGNKEAHRAHLAEVLDKHMQEREALALEHVAWTLTAKEVGDARRTVNNSPKYMGTIMEPVALILKRRAEQLRGKP